MKNLHLVFLLISNFVYSQKIDELNKKILEITKSKDAVVGVAINGSNTDMFYLNGYEKFPMQSVFKFHIALVILSEVDKGKLTLEQKIKIPKEEMIPNTWSPIRDSYPDGVTLTLAEIIRYTVMSSDNIGCDVLLRLLGRPEVVEEYFHGLGFKNFAVKINEEVMQNNWDLQFLNWITPVESNRILDYFYKNENNLLSKKSYDFIWKTMTDTETGANRLKGLLPSGTKVAHKTGWSGVHKDTGISAAVNDVGIVFLPNGEFFYISVFVTNSKEDTPTNERIIAEIAKAAWDYFNN